MSRFKHCYHMHMRMASKYGSANEVATSLRGRRRSPRWTGTPRPRTSMPMTMAIPVRNTFVYVGECSSRWNPPKIDPTWTQTGIFASWNMGLQLKSTLDVALSLESERPRSLLHELNLAMKDALWGGCEQYYSTTCEGRVEPLGGANAEIVRRKVRSVCRGHRSRKI